MPRPKPLVSLHGSVDFEKLVPFDSAAGAPPLANNDILVMRKAAGGDNLTLQISDINATGSVNIAQLVGGVNNDMLYRVGGVWTGTGGVGITFDGSELNIAGPDMTISGGAFSLDNGSGLGIEDGGGIAIEGDGGISVDDLGNIEIIGQGNFEQSGTGNIEISGGGSLMVSADGNIEIEGASAQIILSSGAEMVFEGGAGIGFENGSGIIFDGNGVIDFDGNAGDVIMGTGQILASLGTQLLPGFAFDGDPDTGIFGFGSGQVIFTTNGVQQFIVTPGSFSGTVASAPILRNLAASSTVPNIVISSTDVNTGLGTNGADQLSLIAGADEIARAVEVPGANQFILTPGLIDNNPALPTLAFGDGDTGFFENVDDLIGVSNGGVLTWIIGSGAFSGQNGNAPQLRNFAATNINPSINVNRSDSNTGLGQAGDDTLSIVAGGVEGFRVAEVGAVITNTIFGDLVTTGGGGAGPAIRNRGASATVPTLIPNQADDDTGLSRDTINGISLVAGGLGCIRGRNIGGARAVGFYTTTPIIQQTGVAVTAAAIHAACVNLGLFTA